MFGINGIGVILKIGKSEYRINFNELKIALRANVWIDKRIRKIIVLFLIQLIHSDFSEF